MIAEATTTRHAQPVFDPILAEKIQERFPRLKDVIFLNTSLASVLPTHVEEAYAAEQNRFQGSLASETNWVEERQEAREEVARLIGAKPGNIALLSNTAEGMGIIARDYPWDNRKNIVVYPGEHPSNLLPWILGSRRGNFQLKVIETKGSLCFQDVLNTIDEHTQAVAISAVQYLDGARVDLVTLGSECRKRGILLIVDGIQAMGRLSIDIPAAGVDFLSCGCHKGMMVRNGISFVYCSDVLLKRLNLSSGSMYSVSGSLWKCAIDPSVAVPWREDAQKLENGNRNHPGVCGLIASVKFLNEIGIENIENQIFALQYELYRQLGSDVDKIHPHSDLLSGIVRVDFAAEKREDVISILRAEKIYATIRPDNVRFNIGMFCTMDQMRVLGAVIRTILMS